MAIIPVPTLRSSDSLVQTRLLAQVQFDQLDLLRIQDQLSTGRQFQLPSENAPAAIRAIGLQRLIEQKTQASRNLEDTHTFLSASESAISGVSQLIIDMRALAVSLVDNTKTETERLGAITEITRAIEQLVNNGNSKFRSRSLFAGTQAVEEAFSYERKFVIYNGNEGDLSSFADVGLAFDSNLSGQEVFGAISPGVQGAVDLNPIPTLNTRLTELRGGAGVNQTSILISDGTNDSVIDISGAETLGDVVQLIEASPPAGRELVVRLSGSGLVIEIDPEGGGNLNVREIGGATTAAELGIFNADGVGAGPLIGDDLDTSLTATTSLTEILGARSTAVLTSTDPTPGVFRNNNDLLFEAVRRGAEFNDYRIHYVDDDLLQAADGLTVGTEFARLETAATSASAALTFSGNNNNLILTADTAGIEFNDVTINVASGGSLGAGANAIYDAANKTLTVEIDSGGATEIQNVIAAIGANTPFSAAYDASDTSDGGFLATATVAASDIAVVSGNTANSGGDENTIFIHVESGKTTSAHALVALQNPASGVPALFDVSFDTKDEFGAIGELGSGFVDASAVAVTSGGSGTEFDQASGFRIVNGEQTYTIDVQSAETVEDLLNILNGSAAFVEAEINADGKSINVRSRLSGSDFHIGENGGLTATQLGIRTFTTDVALSTLNHGRGVDAVEGTDFLVRRTDGSEIPVDISTAETIGDVLDLINAAAGETIARLAPTGNGIQIIEGNPVGTTALAVIKNGSSEASWDLGLLPRGAQIAFSTDGATPQPATAEITLNPPNDRDTAFSVTAKQPGESLNGVQVIIDDSGSGAAASVVFDGVGATLTITVDPTATTTNDVLTAINNDTSIPFSAALSSISDPSNDGSGLVAQAGVVGLTSGGTTDPTATAATAAVSFPPPSDLNSAILITATQAGVEFNDVDVVFQDTLSGDTASVAYDPIAKRLTIDIDASATTANTVVAAFAAEPDFDAALDSSVDTGNTGLGLVAELTTKTSGGTPEVLGGRDVNPYETKSIFNTLIKLGDALTEFDLREIERLVAMVDIDFRRANFARADIGARQQSLDSLRVKLDDENVELRRTVSLEIDVDLVEAISNLTSRQAAFEASLRLIGRTFQLTLLEFI